MQFPASRIAAAAVLLCAGLCRAQAPSQQQRCTLSGIVVNSATNAGIPRVLVTYFGAAQGFRFTDTGGNFQAEGVPCQAYNLSVSKPGFVSEQREGRGARITNPAVSQSMEDQEQQANAPPTPANISVNLTPDSSPTRIVLDPMASISGAVVDENSEPLSGVVAQVFAVKASSTGPDYVPSRIAHTDDRGRFELLDLPPGDYVLRLAGESSSTQYFQGNVLNPNNDHRGMQPVYYSKAETPAAAQVFHLAPAENANADFRAPVEPAFDVNGRLAGFIPQAWTQFKLYRDGDRLPLGRAFVNLTTGQFRLTDVPRGSYILRVLQYQADPAAWLASEQPLTVSTQPIQNFGVPLSRAVDIPVSVSYEAGAKDDGRVMLTLQPQHSPENMRQVYLGNGAENIRKFNPAASRTDSFANVVPDRYKFTAQAFSQNGAYVSAARLGDLDVLHGEFTITGASGELHVTVRGDCASLQGKVTFQGQPAVGAQVYLVSNASGEFKIGFADQDGHFQIPNVAPGGYRIQAWTGNPGVNEYLSSTAQSVSLQPSEQHTLSLEAAEPEHKSP